MLACRGMFFVLFDIFFYNFVVEESALKKIKKRKKVLWAEKIEVASRIWDRF